MKTKASQYPSKWKLGHQSATEKPETVCWAFNVSFGVNRIDQGSIESPVTVYYFFFLLACQSDVGVL